MSENFRLSSGDKSFNNRVATLFDSLESVATNLKDEPNEPNLKRSHPTEDEEVEDGDIQEHKFAKPQGRPPIAAFQQKNIFHSSRSSRQITETPDYVKHPKNWTKYSMKDIPNLNDEKNKEIGLALLKDIRKDDENLEYMDTMSDSELNSSNKIVFKKPVNLTTVKEDKEEAKSSSLIDGKNCFVNDEYEVGKPQPCKIDKLKQINHGATSRKKEIKLDYLSFCGDEDEEE